MAISQISETYFVAGQISVDDVVTIKSQGISCLVCNRPDNEAPGQTSFAQIASAAEEHGMQVHYLPVTPGQDLSAHAQELQKILASFEGNILAYCGSGKRAQMVWHASQSL